VFTCCDVDEYRRRTADEQKKQRGMRSFDRDLVRRVRARLGGTRVSVLHPALMYSIYMPYWKQQEAVSSVIETADFRRIAAPPVLGMSARLPQDYVAPASVFQRLFSGYAGQSRYRGGHRRGARVGRTGGAARPRCPSRRSSRFRAGFVAPCRDAGRGMQPETNLRCRRRR
jgi:hypothetical protein